MTYSWEKYGTGGRTDRQTDRRTDGQTDRQIDGQTDRQTDRQTTYNGYFIGPSIEQGLKKEKKALISALE